MPDLNALAPVADINSVIEFVNQQISDGTARIAPEEFYSLQLLDTIRLDADQYVYFKKADAMPIQNKADKLTVRRWAPLQAHTVPLTEGVPPKSDKGSVEQFDIEAFQYGRYMEFTDKVDFKVVDPVVAHYTKEYSLVAMETLDLLAREALMMVAQKYYCGNAAGPDAITAASVPTMADLRKIILSLKKLLVKPRTGSNYDVIGSQEFYFDMFSDPLVQSYMTINQSTGSMYTGVSVPLPDMFNMHFEETMCVPASGEYIDSLGNKRLKYVNSGGVLSTSVHTTVVDLIETDDDEYEVVDGYVQDPRTEQDASYIPGQGVWTLPAGAKEFKMHHILILGKGALARTGLSGQDSAKVYVKPLGSAGVIDPIDQRQSIGFKINSVGFASIHNEAVVDYICVPTQANV